MEYNKKNLGAKLKPTGGDNSEYEEETENDIEDDEDVYMEQNFTDVSKIEDVQEYRDINFI